MAKTTGTKKVAASKKKRNILMGMISIQATFNNTIVTVSDLQGNVISWSSAGKMGFKGSKKLLHMQLKQLLLMLLKKQKNMVYKQQKFN